MQRHYTRATEAKSTIARNTKGHEFALIYRAFRTRWIPALTPRSFFPIGIYPCPFEPRCDREKHFHFFTKTLKSQFRFRRNKGPTLKLNSRPVPKGNYPRNDVSRRKSNSALRVVTGVDYTGRSSNRNLGVRGTGLIKEWLIHIHRAINNGPKNVSVRATRTNGRRQSEQQLAVARNKIFPQSFSWVQFVGNFPAI